MAYFPGEMLDSGRVLLKPAPSETLTRVFTVHFQYFAEIEPHIYHLSAGQQPVVEGGVLRFCTAEDVYYEYNWDLIAHTTLTLAKEEAQ